jgi:hypothetical protein
MSQVVMTGYKCPLCDFCVSDKDYLFLNHIKEKHAKHDMYGTFDVLFSELVSECNNPVVKAQIKELSDTILPGIKKYNEFKKQYNKSN